MPDLRKGRVLVKNWHEFELKGMQSGAKVQKRGRAMTVRSTVKIGETNDDRARWPLHDRTGARTGDRAGVLRISRGSTARETSGGGRGDPLRRIRCSLAPASSRTRDWGQGQHPRLQRRGSPRLPNREAESAQMEAYRSAGRGNDRRIRQRSNRVDRRARSHRAQRRGINFCVDLSATPYYLARAEADTNRIFPWVVSDFGLTDAIESGLVKIPQLAVTDPTGEQQAAYFNIWRWIMTKLTAARRGGDAPSLTQRQFFDGRTCQFRSQATTGATRSRSGRPI